MDAERWKELGEQALVGFVYGFASGLAVAQDFGTAALIGILTAAVKGAAHAVVKLLAPPAVNAGVKFRKMTKYEKWDRVL